MTNYRRSDIAGATYFFTVNLGDRSQSLLTEHIALLRNAFEYTRERHHFTVADWPHSSFHRYVRADKLPMDWAGDAGIELACGERRSD